MNYTQELIMGMFYNPEIEDLMPGQTLPAPAPRLGKAAKAERSSDYYRIKKQESRERARAAKAAGEHLADASTVRDVLADAALLLLAAGGPGADAVRAHLEGAYPHKPGAVLSIVSSARLGTLKPKLLKSPAM